MDKITSDVRRQQWLEIIQACNTSGLTKKAWCEQNGINMKSFYANAFSRCSFEYISCSLSEPFKVQLFVRTPR